MSRRFSSNSFVNDPLLYPGNDPRNYPRDSYGNLFGYPSTLDQNQYGPLSNQSALISEGMLYERMLNYSR